MSNFIFMLPAVMYKKLAMSIQYTKVGTLVEN